MEAIEKLVHFLIPHYSNNHRAKVLHEPSLFLILVFFLFFQLVLSLVTGVVPSVLGFASNITANKVMELTNQERAKAGLSSLAINDKLNEVARQKAGDMFAFNYWAHVSPSGRDPWSFFKETGYDYLYAGENLARDFADSDLVVNAWMNSLTHRDNIMNKNYTEIGLAVVNGKLKGVETTLVVQVFGTPANTSWLTKVVPLAKASLGESSQAVVSNDLAISPFWLTKIIAVFILGLILGALIVDIIFVSRRKVIRLSGKNWAHLIFVGTLFLITLLTTQGAIL